MKNSAEVETRKNATFNAGYSRGARGEQLENFAISRLRYTIVDAPKDR